MYDEEACYFETRQNTTCEIVAMADRGDGGSFGSFGSFGRPGAAAGSNTTLYICSM